MGDPCYQKGQERHFRREVRFFDGHLQRDHDLAHAEAILLIFAKRFTSWYLPL